MIDLLLSVLLWLPVWMPLLALVLVLDGMTR
jgi:hypothetical protein